MEGDLGGGSGEIAHHAHVFDDDTILGDGLGGEEAPVVDRRSAHLDRVGRLEHGRDAARAHRELRRRLRRLALLLAAAQIEGEGALAESILEELRRLLGGLEVGGQLATVNKRPVVH